MKDEVFDSVEDHLREERSEGKRVDDGVFTIKTEQALKKLRTHGLENPEFWVLKVLQAAVASGASSVDYTFQRKVVLITFPNAAEWSGSRILEAFEAGPNETDRALSHLQMGLLVALGDGRSVLAWTCGGRRTSIEGQKSSHEDVRDDGLVRLRVTRTGDGSGGDIMNSPIRHLFKQSAAEYKALIERGRYSPVPVTIDGYKLPRRYGRNPDELCALEVATNRSDVGAALLGLAPIQDLSLQESLTFPLADLEFQHSSQWSMMPETLQTQYWKPDPGPVHAILSLFTTRNHCHEVNFILDGVWLERVKLRSLFQQGQEVPPYLDALDGKGDYGFALAVDVPVSPDQVDLSHFKVRTDFVAELVPKLEPQVVAILKTVQSSSHLPWNYQDFPEVSAGLEDLAVDDILGYGMIALASPFLLTGCVVLPLVGLLTMGRRERRSEELGKRIEETLARLTEERDSERG